MEESEPFILEYFSSNTFNYFYWRRAMLNFLNQENRRATNCLVTGKVYEYPEVSLPAVPYNDSNDPNGFHRVALKAKIRNRCEAKAELREALDSLFYTLWMHLSEDSQRFVKEEIAREINCNDKAKRDLEVSQGQHGPLPPFVPRETAAIWKQVFMASNSIQLWKVIEKLHIVRRTGNPELDSYQVSMLYHTVQQDNLSLAEYKNHFEYILECMKAVGRDYHSETDHVVQFIMGLDPTRHQAYRAHCINFGNWPDSILTAYFKASDFVVTLDSGSAAQEGFEQAVSTRTSVSASSRNNANRRGLPSTPCPACHRGYHWKRDCHFRANPNQTRNNSRRGNSIIL